METLQEPSLADYARFHGIASDFMAVDPLEYAHNIAELGSENYSISQKKLSEFKIVVQNARDSLDKISGREKLNVPKESAHFLASFIRENRVQNVDVKWKELLPKFSNLNGFKLDPPILNTGFEDYLPFRKAPSLYKPCTVNLNPLGGSPECRHDLKLHAGIVNKPTPTKSPPGTEKLNCPKSAIPLILDAKKQREISSKDIGNRIGVLWSVFKPVSIQPVSPPLHPLSPIHPSHRNTSPNPGEQILSSPISPDAIGKGLGPASSSIYPPPAINPTRKLVQEKMRISSSKVNGYPNLNNNTPTTKQDRRRKNISDNILVQNAEPVSSRNDGHDKRGLLEVKSRSTFAPADDSCANVSPKTPEANILESPYSPQFAPDNLMKGDGLPMVASPESINPQNTTNRTYRKQDHKPFTNNGDEKKLDLPEIESNCLVSPPSDKLSTNPSEMKGSQYYEKRKTEHNQKNPRKRPNISSGQSKKIVKSIDKRSALSVPRKTLGTLFSFMETRKYANNKQLASKSPYFPRIAPGESVNQQNSKNPVRTHQGQLSDSKNESTHLALDSKFHIPQGCKKHGGLVLFVSTALLKTHLQLLHSLEGIDYSPRILYRDNVNSDAIYQFQSQITSAAPRPNLGRCATKEADIIISPKTGIILTTSQAVMQVHLPGYKPRCSHIYDTRHVNSPLREQILHLSRRYEQIYILISHAATQTKNSRGLENTRLVSDKNFLASLASLTAFCNLISTFATVSPLLMPLSPEIAAAWILALAHKHACQLPPAPISQASYSIKFTPVNPKHSLVHDLGDMEETMWELFLRGVGLNPYAAQIVLLVLRRGGSNLGSTSRKGETSTHSGPKLEHLSRFIEMSSEERQILFVDLLGERTLKRLSSIIEKDWQCDWALDFKNISE